MRPTLVDPVQDQAKLRELLPLVEQVFALHEAGANYSAELKTISRLLGLEIDQLDVYGAFGSGSPEYFAKRLMIHWHSVPSDLSPAEMLELVEALCSASGSAAAQDYWVRCLQVNTGDDRISDLIFWPNEYFGDGVERKDLSASEILSIALGRRQSDALYLPDDRS